MVTTRINYLTDIYFGSGALTELGGVLKERSISRPLIVTDPALAKLGIIDRLGIKAAAVFDRVESNPTENRAIEGLEVFRTHQCDCLIAVGGGSPIDLAKAIALGVNHPGPLEQYALIHGGLNRITADLPVLVAVPTTAGTGSEVGRAALITLATGEKLALVSPRLIPDAAICDPELTLSMPASLTAATGMDAISHCVENFCSPHFNPVADAIALDGLERAMRHIRRTTDALDDREARGEMMMAALEGGLTFQKGLGAVHALSHPLGALPTRPHHGTLNAIFLPHVLRFNTDACPRKIRAMSARLGLVASTDLPDVFSRLCEDLKLPVKLEALQITASDIEPLASKAMADHCSRSNPRPMNIESCRQLYRAAL